jgi:short subunit dehydrogenase-like uncharacterized protein
MENFLLYGANGYTGELIVRYAKTHDLHPVLAGRSASAIESLALKYSLPFHVFDLTEKEKLLEALREVNLVLNAAGPFDSTAKPIIEACLETGTHYIDINGDISVFEMIKTFDDPAKKAGIMLLPGSGFDVVPTDCLARYLKNELPGAVSLQLAFATLGGGLSHGTATTMINKLGKGGMIRENGELVKKPLGHKGAWIDFKLDDGTTKGIFVMTIPWGDVATAFYSTAIPNIESYTGISRKIYYALKGQFLFNWLLRSGLVKNIARKRINNAPPGPSDEQRKKSRSLVWGKATDAKGNSVSHSFSGPDGYTMTMLACSIIVQKILDGNLKPGFQTPATAYGPDLLREIPGMAHLWD